MDNKKFEQLIELIINENEEQARALFHDIVVEKSREIYENIIAEEMDMEEEAGEMVGEVGDLMDEISAEESGVVEADDEEEFDIGDDEGDEVVDFEAGEGEDEDQGGLEDRVVDLEDKLDQLMAEFEEIMGDDEEEEGIADIEAGEEDEEGVMEATDDDEEDLDEAEDMDEEEVMEAIQLKKVSVTHGDNGQQTKSTVAANSGAKGMASKPVSMGHGNEAVPTSPKGPSNAYSKGETQVKHASQWKNAPAQAGQNLEKAPAPKKGDDGSNTKSVIESRKMTKKRI